MKSIITFVLLSVLMAFLFACGLTPSNGPTRTGPNPIVRPLANAEAEMATVWLSGELTAPNDLYKRVRDDLSAIRSEWGDTIGMVDSVYYHSYSEIGTMIIGFDSTTFESVVAGTYMAWDSLNMALNIDTITFQSWGHSVMLRFKGRLNPVLLVDLYAGLPGAKWIETNGLAGDGPMVTMLQEGDEIKYFFRNAWGDCPAGCMHSHIAYFVSHDDSIRFVGEHGPYFERSSVDWPMWMDTFAIAFNNWQQYRHWDDTTGHDVTLCDSLVDIRDLSEYRPYSNEEAEIAALVMSEELVAPLRLTRRIENDLRSFRAMYGDSIEAVNIEYHAPWRASVFTMRLEDGLLTDSLHPGHELLQCLNEKLRMKRIRKYSNSEWHNILFDGRLNSNVIAEMYTHVPGMKQIYVAGYAGDLPDLYIMGDSTEMKYFFRDAWGDCPAGCIHQNIFYFNSKNGNYRFFGSWNPNTEIIPVWGDAVFIARAQKFQYFHWSESDSVGSYSDEAWSIR